MKFSDIFWITTLLRLNNQHHNDDNDDNLSYGCNIFLVIGFVLLFTFCIVVGMIL